MKKRTVLALVSCTCLVPCLAGAADSGFYIGVDAGQSRTELDEHAGRFVAMRGTLIDSSRDREDTTIGFHVGYELTAHFAIELGYSDLGAPRYTSERDLSSGLYIPGLPGSPVPSFSERPPTVAPSLNEMPPNFIGGVLALPTGVERQELTFDGESLSLSLIGRYELAKNFSLIGRAGLAAHRFESNLRVWLDGREIRVIGDDAKHSAGAGLLGLGVEWAFHRRWSVSVQAQHHFMFGDDTFNLVERGDVTQYTGGVNFRF